MPVPTSSAPTQFDVIVIGGGPAGMMAAATAAKTGARVLLLEQNSVLGKKLAITGGGRCNITNNKPVVRDMLAEYREAGKFLFSTFTQHGVVETIAWFMQHGVPFIEEQEGRLFPASQSAKTIVAVLKQVLNDHRVVVHLETKVTDIAFVTGTKKFVITTASAQFFATACVLATGGYARPETGSTGDGFTWLKKFTHTISAPDDALVPIALSDPWVKTLGGLTLSKVRVSVRVAGKKVAQKQGRLLFTHFGVSGPLILNLSHVVAEHIHTTDVFLMVDLFPDSDAETFTLLLRHTLQSNKKIQNALADLLPAQLVRAVLTTLRIDGSTPCHSVRKEDRMALALYLKAVPLQVAHLLGKDKAIVSSGGVVLPEIDFRTMASKVVPGLFVVGDLLNINRPSGGYSLQLCWSTGFVAGKHAAAYSFEHQT